MSFYFTPLNGNHLAADGTKVLIASEATDVRRGHVASLHSTGALIKSQAVNSLGLFYDFFTYAEVPTTDIISDHSLGKEVAYIHGNFEALVGSDLITGTITVGAPVYCNAATGVLTTTEPGGAGNGIVCGHVLETGVSIGGGQDTVIRIRFNFDKVL